MTRKTFSIQNIAYFLLVAVIVTYILSVGQFFIIPFLFAILLSIIILPVQHFYDRYIRSQALSTIVAFLTVLIPIIGIITFFSMQVGFVLSDLDNISLRVQTGTETLFKWASEYFHISKEESQSILKDNFTKIVSSPLSLVQSTLNSFTGILLNIALIFLFMFFLLAYRISIKNFVLMQFSPAQRLQAAQTITDIQKMLRQYLSGLISVMMILAVLNSVGLWFIGVEYPFLWASLAAFLTIIPYIGTTLGGGLPFFYALATAESWHQPVAIIIMYVTIQQVEGNLITPYVVGSKVRINPLVAIIGILLMNALWGMVGIILAIPLTAGVKILFDRVDALRPIGALMSSNVLKKQALFLSDWDHEKYRLSSIFFRSKKVKKAEVFVEAIHEDTPKPRQ
jgi:predicted PurR-regulated permease PerM